MDTVRRLLVLFVMLIATPSFTEAGTIGAGRIGTSRLKTASVPLQDLGASLNSSLSNYFGGKTDTGTQWALFTDYEMTKNSSCWAIGLDWTGFVQAQGNNNGINSQTSPGGDVALITTRHGITCHHAFMGTYATNYPGWRLRARGSDGTYYTNWVEKITVFDTAMANDIALVTFSNNWPAAISPFWVLPTNYLAHVVMTNRWMMWYQNDSLKLHTTTSATLWSEEAMRYYGGDSVPGSSFNNGTAVGGDSGAPVMFVLGTNIVFVGPLTFASIGGPFVSTPHNLPLIEAELGTNVLKKVDLTPYL